MTPVSTRPELPQRIRTFVAAAAIAPFIVGVLHAVPGSDARGQVSAPHSRLAKCAQVNPIESRTLRAEGIAGQRNCGVGHWADPGNGAATPAGTKGVFKKKPSYLEA
ncbi:hypothetical protein ACFYO1_32895 [Nocardia sp. NPDC006044]|uniref:hypothetical protein n=1 Tax=Nocardia sp. NPDC006044 TaxID=3364306 RepID=UPI0036BD1068